MTDKKYYRAILFDMDGVVVDSMRYHADGWQTVFKENCGIDLTREDVLRREGMSGLSSIVDIFIEKGIEVPSESELVRLREKKLELFEQNEIQVFPEMRTILEFLHFKNIRMGLVTGSLRRSVQHVLKDDILKYFRAIVTVDDISIGKPHPQPYLYGIDRLGVEKSSVLAVENAPMGITSAKGAGIDCFAIETTLGEDFLSGADKVFKNHRELHDYFRDLYGIA
jgi:beta-phosphoglucomutase